jgi:CheY-like chemotaxis protein
VLDVPDDLLVRAEEASLVQVVVNLVVNAAQAIPRDRRGRIAIRAYGEGKRVQLEVTDDGSGMSDETKRRLFEPFYTTKAFGEGTGLGLSVSLGLVRSMGGDIEATSEPGRTTMRLSLVQSSSPSSSARIRISHTRPRRTLLLVDDEPDVRKALARSLRGSFSVILAEGPEDALAKLCTTTVDVILSDAQMPQGGGARLYREIAARWPEMSARVIFFTGGVHTAANLSEFGRPVLGKPLVLEELFATLDRMSV